MNYRLSSQSADTSGARLMQTVFLNDTSGIITLEQDVNSTSLAKKWLAFDKASLIFSKSVLPTATEIFQVYQSLGGQYVQMQVYSGGEWTSKTASNPQYHGVANYSQRQVAFGPDGSHYHTTSYSTSTHVERTEDNGETYTESADIGYNSPRGMIVPQADWIVLYNNLTAQSGYFAGTLISEDAGATWTNYVTGMRFDKIIKWGSDLIGYYNDRIFKSSDYGVTWDGTAYATAGIQITPKSGYESFIISDMFVYNNELHLIVQYMETATLFGFTGCVKFATYPVSSSSGTEVSEVGGIEFEEWYGTNLQLESEVVISSSSAYSTGIEPYYLSPISINWLTGATNIIWEQATNTPPSDANILFYDRVGNKFVCFYQELNYEEVITGYTYEYNPETGEYDIEVPTYGYDYVVVKDNTAYWTPGGAPSFSETQYRTNWYNAYSNTITNK